MDGSGARSRCPAPPVIAHELPLAIGPLRRWCPTYPEYFAVSTSSPARGAVVHVHNAAYPHAPPTAFHVAPRPLHVRAFDFVAGRGVPRIAAAVGRDVVVFYIGVDA